jgi:hypothetical protein
MLLTTERPSGTRTAIRAWQSLFAGLGTLWPVFLGCAVLSIAWGFAATALGNHLPVSPIAFVTAEPPSTNGIWPLLGFDLLSLIVQSLITAPVAVAMHRFILLGETRARLAAHRDVIVRFAIWLVALRLPFLFPQFARLLAGPERFGAYLVVLGLAVLLLCLTLLFPAVAVEDPSTGAAGRLETALDRTAGNFWLLVRAIFIAFLPFILLWAVFGFVLIRRISAGVGGSKPALNAIVHANPVLMVAGGCITPLFVGLGAAVASWIYSYAITRTRAAA